MNSYKSIFKEKMPIFEMAYIGEVRNIRIEVHTDHMPFHFHAIKKDNYEVRILIESIEVLSYKWQKNGKEISSDELKYMKKWLQEPNKKQSKISNLEAIKLSWNQLNPDKEI